jgi:hypothetical protein
MAHGINHHIPLTPLVEVVSHDSLEPAEMPRSVVGARAQTTLPVEVVEALDDILFSRTARGVHHVNNNAIAGIDVLLSFHGHVVSQGFPQLRIRPASDAPRPSIQPRIAFFAIRGWTV